MTGPKQPEDPDGPDSPRDPGDPGGAGIPGGVGGAEPAGAGDGPSARNGRSDGPDGPDGPADHERAGPPPRGCRCCLVAFGGVLFFIAPFAVVTVFLLTMSGSPDDSVRDWLDAVRQGRYEAAVHQMCPRYRNSLSATELRSRLARSGGISKDEIGQTITRSSREATVRTTITGAGGTREVSISVVRDGDLWRVCSLP